MNNYNFVHKSNSYTYMEVTEYVQKVNYNYALFNKNMGINKAICNMANLLFNFFWHQRNFKETWSQDMFKGSQISDEDAFTILVEILIRKIIPSFDLHHKYKSREENFFHYCKCILEKQFPEECRKAAFQIHIPHSTITNHKKLVEKAKKEVVISDDVIQEENLVSDTLECDTEEKLLAKEIEENILSLKNGIFLLESFGFYNNSEKKTVKEIAEKYDTTPKTVNYYNQKNLNLIKEKYLA